MSALLRKILIFITNIRYVEMSFSQEGEDRILNRVFENQNTGFYVDVGAYHPIKYSNTFLFYLKGWRGINIEPRQKSAQLFQKCRSRDLNLEMGINDSNEALTYYEFNEGALNTFSKSLADHYSQNTPYKLVRKSLIEMKRLDEVLSVHLPKGEKISFLNVDAEGLDLKVLKSNDWERFRPQYVMCEILEGTEDLQNHETVNFMAKNGYRFQLKTMNTVFFKDVANEP